MSGFKDDVISILRDNVLLHAEAMGLIMAAEDHWETRELLKYLENEKLPVSGKVEKIVLLFDYVIMHRELVCTLAFLDAFANVGKMGIIIVDVSDEPSSYESVYKSYFGNFTVSKLKYGNRTYLVFHKGVDYGN